MTFGLKLKELRIAKNKSLQDVANAIGVSKAHLWDLEKGKSKNPSLDLITGLASYFKISVAELVGEDPNALNEEPELVALYRDLKALGPTDLEAISLLVNQFKKRKQAE